MNQNLASYRIFYAVANAKNISKAAKELYISQPAISKSIRKLEESIGAKLFSRSSRGVALTPEGELLYGHVKSAFESLALGEEQLRRSIQLGIGHLSIGVSSTLCKYLLLPFLKEFIKQYPHIRISIDCHSTNHTLQLLEEEKIDVGLIGEPKTAKNICFYPFQEIEDIFVASPDYLRNLNLRGVPNQKILQKSTVMLLDKENMTRQYMDDYFLEQKIVVQDSIETSSLDLLIEFSKIGLGVGCVIRSFVQAELTEGLLAEIPLKVPIPKRVVGFACNKHLRRSKSLEHFLSFYKPYATVAQTTPKSGVDVL